MNCISPLPGVEFLERGLELLEGDVDFFEGGVDFFDLLNGLSCGLATRRFQIQDIVSFQPVC